jgi:hypothetical protein
MTILVLSAFVSETKRLMDKYRARMAASEKSFRIFQTEFGEVTLRFGITGEGKESLRRFFEWYGARAGSYELPGLIISTGYAGALKKELKAGDIVMADSVTDVTSGKNYQLEIPSVLRTKYPRWLCSGLTVGRLTEADAKAVLSGQRPDAAFVDMESSAVMDYCGVRRLPCWIVRSISDRLGFRFPKSDLVRDKWTDIPPLRWLYRIFTDPADFSRAVRLQINLWKAQKNIASAVSAVLRELIS